MATGLGRWIQILAWDGILPLVIASIPIIVRTVLPKNDLAEVGTFLIIPMLAAIIRSMIASGQIRARCAGKLPIGRQTAMGGAIILLFLFEMFASALTFSDDEPAIAWITVAGFYVLYLFAIAAALRGAKSESMPRTY